VVSPLSSPSGFESSGVSCSSKRRCLLVGTVYGPGSSHGLAFSWNGHHWSRVSARQTRSAGGLDAVTCVPSGCWAVGSLFAAAYSNWTLRWQHGHWSSVSAPTPAGGSGLLGVSCVLRLSNCWAVGAVGSFSRTNEILHRTGGHWRLS
jgi:hypothetical protein